MYLLLVRPEDMRDDEAHQRAAQWAMDRAIRRGQQTNGMGAAPFRVWL